MNQVVHIILWILLKFSHQSLYSHKVSSEVQTFKSSELMGRRNIGGKGKEEKIKSPRIICKIETEIPLVECSFTTPFGETFTVTEDTNFDESISCHCKRNENSKEKVCGISVNRFKEMYLGPWICHLTFDIGGTKEKLTTVNQTTTLDKEDFPLEALSSATYEAVTTTEATYEAVTTTEALASKRCESTEDCYNAANCFLVKTRSCHCSSGECIVCGYGIKDERCGDLGHKPLEETLISSEEDYSTTTRKSAEKCEYCYTAGLCSRGRAFQCRCGIGWCRNCRFRDHFCSRPVPPPPTTRPPPTSTARTTRPPQTTSSDHPEPQPTCRRNRDCRKYRHCGFSSSHRRMKCNCRRGTCVNVIKVKRFRPKPLKPFWRAL